MDFSENYSFIVQDTAQGYHWENSQCTLHPFVFYFKMHDSTIGHESFCFISDSTKHSTAMVYTFLKKLIPHLKQAHDQIRKIIYFSDGCAAQYKNRYSFINLIHNSPREVFLLIALIYQITAHNIVANIFIT